jgi:hypothetical protein
MRLQLHILPTNEKVCFGKRRWLHCPRDPWRFSVQLRAHIGHPLRLRWQRFRLPASLGLEIVMAWKTNRFDNISQRSARPLSRSSDIKAESLACTECPCAAQQAGASRKPWCALTLLRVWTLLVLTFHRTTM